MANDSFQATAHELLQTWLIFSLPWFYYTRQNFYAFLLVILALRCDIIVYMNRSSFEKLKPKLVNIGFPKAKLFHALFKNSITLTNS